MLTASECYTVANFQSEIAVGNFLYRKLWSTEKVTSAALSYGLQNEAKALKSYRESTNGERLQAIETGLWVNGKNPELACSPMGLNLGLDEANGTYCILEIKCPKMLEDKKISDFETLLSTTQFKTFCLEVVDGEIKIEAKTSLLLQIQMQMGLSL
ncbi:hypothetical protein DPMN_020354 [Dreissena polymorpha]|uniref:YqaJ viral recombinase domain-containing protein n=1 Tax=Dreissena polymorpha TaxID=45954 RepID=A0A9D4NK33_DREPO|nr:hypothetical protein DPMN_020354 [Dreissena polymorpha]